MHENVKNYDKKEKLLFFNALISHFQGTLAFMCKSSFFHGSAVWNAVSYTGS